MTSHKIHVKFPGRIVFIGFGSIGQGVLPLILRHIGTDASRITVVAPDERGSQVVQHFGVNFIKQAIKQDNLRSVLTPLVGEGDFVINVSVDVSSIDLIRFLSLIHISEPTRQP
jgi:homospermidine synthase